MILREKSEISRKDAWDAIYRMGSKLGTSLLGGRKAFHSKKSAIVRSYNQVHLYGIKSQMTLLGAVYLEEDTVHKF